MTFPISGAVAALALGLTATAAAADCTHEVQQAFVRQSHADRVRKDMNLIGEQGPFKMVVEYVKPDRMRQVVTTLAEPDKPTETVLVGSEAWSKAAEGWQKLDPATTEQLVAFFKSTVGDVPANVGTFECLGAETVEGQKVRAYKGVDEKKPESPEATEAKKRGETVAEAPKNEAVRVIYLDVDSGLPARIVFAREGMLDKPIFKEVYSYPTDLKIEKPESAQP